MTEQALFRIILARSWALIRERPSLWVYGILASGVGGIGVVELAITLVRFFKNSTNASLNDLQFTSFSAVYYWLMPPYNNIFLPLFAIVLILIGAIFFLIAVIGFGALIRGTVEKKPQPLATLWHHGVYHMWHMAGLILLRKIIVTILVVFGVACGYAITRSTGVWASGLLAALWTIVTLAVLIVSFLSIYTATAMSIDRLHIKDAFFKAFQVFRNHVLVSIEMSLTLFCVELIILILCMGLFIVFAVPVYLLFLVGIITNIMTIFKIAVIVAVSLMFIVGLIVGGFLTVFEVSVWSALYIKTRDGVIGSRILHFFGIKK